LFCGLALKINARFRFLAKTQRTAARRKTQKATRIDLPLTMMKIASRVSPLLFATSCLFTIVLPSAANYSPAKQHAAVSQRRVVTQPSRSTAVETVQFRSELIGKTLPYNVVLPSDYAESRVRRYPVLFLLHGYAGHYSDWLTRTNIADYAAQYRMIIVMPEGNDGWYIDSASAATDKYESYFIKELIPDVQRRYRTIESRYGRGVAGLSMGGYGALKFGLKYPQMFAFAGSFSGALAAPAWTEQDLGNLKSIYESLLNAFGPFGS
jgi:S-formylglutathione hydrolase FrmB